MIQLFHLFFKFSFHLSPLCAMLQEVDLSGLHQFWSMGNFGQRSEGGRGESEVRIFITLTNSDGSFIG